MTRDQHSWLKGYPPPHPRCDVVYDCAFIQDHTLVNKTLGSVWPFKWNRYWAELNFEGSWSWVKKLTKLCFTPQHPEEVNQQKTHSSACTKQFQTAQFPCFNVCRETAHLTRWNPTEKKADALLTWIIKSDIVGFYFLSFQDLCFSCVITDNFRLHAYALGRKRMFAVISKNHEQNNKDRLE